MLANGELVKESGVLSCLYSPRRRVLGNPYLYARISVRCRGVCKRLCSASFLEEFFSETEMSGNPPASNIQSIVLRRKRRNVILQPFAIVSRREREEEGCNVAR